MKDLTNLFIVVSSLFILGVSWIPGYDDVNGRTVSAFGEAISLNFSNAMILGIGFIVWGFTIFIFINILLLPLSLIFEERSEQFKKVKILSEKWLYVTLAVGDILFFLYAIYLLSQISP